MAMKLRTRTTDGKMFYIIGSVDISKEHCVIVDNIQVRDSLAGKVDGFVLVENAIDDSTVHRGWAMYLYAKSSTLENKWIKVAEQESVDGIWGINEELLRQFVTWNNFTSALNAQKSKNEKYEETARQMQEVYDKVHEHTNRGTIDAFDIRGGFDEIEISPATETEPAKYKKVPNAKSLLTWDGGKLVCNTLTYSEFDDDGHLVWRNPIIREPKPTPVDSSQEIMDLLLDNASTIFSPGVFVQIQETDGSYSKYLIYKEEDTLKSIFVCMLGCGVLKSTGVTMTTQLPSASRVYVNKGYFYLLPPALCGHKALKFYQCVGEDGGYVWEALGEASLDQEGAKFSTCYRKDWNTIAMTWDDPRTVSKASSFYRTIIVRKFDSAPTNPADGVVVFESFVANEHADTPFIDVHPITHTPVYYAVFTQSNAGDWFKDSASSVVLAKFPDWTYIKSLMETGKVDKMFTVGDIVVSPVNEIFDRSVDFTVVAVEPNALKLIARNSIGSYCYDGVEDGLTETEDTSFDSTKVYFNKELQDDGQMKYYRWTGATTGSPVDLGLFELPVNTAFEVLSETTDAYTGRLHGSNMWINSNLKVWLNFKEAGDWYSGKSPDQRGIDETQGFAAAFTDAVFKELISEVTLPSSDIGTLSDFIETVSTEMWAKGSDENPGFESEVVYDGKFDVKTEPAETKLPVYPVITLRVDPPNE